MNPLWIYLLKVNLGIVLFYSFYKLICQRDTFFQWRRFTLLSFLGISLLYPLFDIQHWVMEQPALHELADTYTAWINVDEPTLVVTSPIPTSKLPNLMTLVNYLYFLGIIVLSIRFFIQFFSICRMRWIGKVAYINGQRIISLPFETNPFSFFGWIFLYLPKLDEKTLNEILMHEQTHTRQWHSVDVILSEIANIICWFNPFSWFLKSEIQLNLEFLADNHVAENTEDCKSYQHHLLEFAHIDIQNRLCNHFNVSPLKSRILMMNKKRTCMVAYLKYAFLIPLIAILFAISNINCTIIDINTPTEKQVKEKKTFTQVVEEPIESEKNIPIEIPTKEENIAPSVTKPDNHTTDIPVTKPIEKEEVAKTEEIWEKNEIETSVKRQVRGEESSQIGEKLQEDEENLEKEINNPTGKKQSNYQVGRPLFFTLLLKNLTYPPELFQKEIQGEVIIEAINRKDGELTDIKLIQGVHPLLDNEVLRVINDMPKGAYYKHKLRSDPKIKMPIQFEIIGNRIKITI